MTPLHLGAALLMVALWGFNFVVMRWGLDQVPPLTLSALRFGLAAFPALLLVRPPRASWPLVAGYGLFAFSGQFSLLFTGMAVGMPTGLASLVIQIQAFFTIGLAALLTGERPRAAQIAGALLAGSGVLLVALHLGGGSRLGLLLIVLAALSWAVANTIVRRIPLDPQATRSGPLAIIVWGSAVATLPLAAGALLIESPQAIASVVTGLTAPQWLGLAFQAWPVTLLAFAVWAWLLRLYPASLIAPFTLLVPVVGMTSAALLLGESVTWWKLTGAALVLGGLALNVMSFRRA
jgi:O-acetylserine/cysteine efflux transporter